MQDTLIEQEHSIRHSNLLPYIAVAAGVGIALFLPLFVKNRYTMNIFIMVLFYAFMGSAWNIVCGFVGELSLGHSAFVGVGGYVSSLMLIHLKFSPWFGMLAGIVISIIFGMIIGYPCFRLRGPYFTLTTIAFAELLRIYVTNTDVAPLGIPLKGAMGLLLPISGNSFGNFMFKSKNPYYYIILCFLLISITLTYIIRRNRLGYYLIAIKSDPNAAESLGINITKYKLIAMAISSGLIACAGTFYAQFFAYIGPERIFGMDLSVQIALIALIGGQGTVIGPVLGALVLVPLSELLNAHLGGSLAGLHLFVYGLIMVIVVLFMPNGIHAILKKLFERMTTRAKS